MTLPLDGILVIDFSQFLSGPLCALKLADLGARVIKIERPGQGDLCRTLYLSDTEIGGTNSLFHAINRNKESFTADLRDEAEWRSGHRFDSTGGLSPIDGPELLEIGKRLKK